MTENDKAPKTIKLNNIQDCRALAMELRLETPIPMGTGRPPLARVFAELTDLGYKIIDTKYFNAEKHGPKAAKKVAKKVNAHDIAFDIHPEDPSGEVISEAVLWTQKEILDFAYGDREPGPFNTGAIFLALAAWKKVHVSLVRISAVRTVKIDAPVEKVEPVETPAIVAAPTVEEAVLVEHNEPVEPVKPIEVPRAVKPTAKRVSKTPVKV